MEKEQLERSQQNALALSAAMRLPLSDLFSRIRIIAAHEEMLTPFLRQELEAILYTQTDAAVIYPDGDELTMDRESYASARYAAAFGTSTSKSYRFHSREQVLSAYMFPVKIPCPRIRRSLWL